VTKVAVTGASGFVGRHVLAELEKRGIETIATSSTTSDRSHTRTGSFPWVALDIKNPPENCLATLGYPDVLIHLAWAGLPNYKSMYHVEIELPVQYRFIRQLVAEGLKSLLTVGTCFEYGFQYGPLAADAQTRPSNPYGLSKDTLHRQLQLLKAHHPFSLTWARLFYMYGEGQPETSLLPLLKRAVSEGQTVFNMSQGEQLRDYLPVTEVARRLVDLALYSKDHGAINVCSGVPISVRRLVETWIKENGWEIDLALGHYPYPDYEPMAFWGKNSSAS
jgi:dTDP-6-deoxy-L-talose 4-dehydrogenase (NAD+)